VLDVLAQSRRNTRAALKLMRKLLKKYGFVPDKLVTDDLRSYAAAAGDLKLSNRHERGRWRNNRAGACTTLSFDLFGHILLSCRTNTSKRQEQIMTTTTTPPGSSLAPHRTSAGLRHHRYAQT